LYIVKIGIEISHKKCPPTKIVFVREHNYFCQQKTHLCIFISQNVYFLLTNTYIGQREYFPLIKNPLAAQNYCKGVFM